MFTALLDLLLSLIPLRLLRALDNWLRVRPDSGLLATHYTRTGSAMIARHSWELPDDMHSEKSCRKQGGACSDNSAAPIPNPDECY